MKKIVLALGLVLIGFNISCTSIAESNLKQYVTPTKLFNESVDFADDINFEFMHKAIDRQIKTLKRFSSSTTLKMGQREVSRDELIDSLKELKKISSKHMKCTAKQDLAVCNVELNQMIKAKFEVYVPALDSSDPRATDPKPALYTSYYSPDFDGSFDKTDEFKHAIYKAPSDQTLKKSSREQIDFEGALNGKDLEIVYVKQSLYDIYLLHVEGGGRVKIKNSNGDIDYKFLSYQSSNKNPFSFIHKYMLAQGYLQGDRSIDAQRNFLNTNPHLQREIFRTCPSYIYFKLTDHEPYGIDGLYLTEKRSAALDKKHYPMSGLITFVQTKKASRSGNLDYSRFWIHQDTGGAIRGKARADLYAGFGADAEYWANHTNFQGTMYFLIIKAK